MIAYLDRKRATCQAKTVSGIATQLKHFGVFLAQVDPGLDSIAHLDRRRHIEPYLTSLVEAVNSKERRAHHRRRPLPASASNPRCTVESTYDSAASRRGRQSAGHLSTICGYSARNTSADICGVVRDLIPTAASLEGVRVPRMSPASGYSIRRDEVITYCVQRNRGTVR